MQSAVPLHALAEARTTHRTEPTIEGLRAFAVLAVLLHHAFPSVLPGGFVGVDVFFVISGFLIGGKLIGDAREGTFSFARFYAARMRRLFPALIVVLVATWLAGAWLLTCAEFGALGRHVLASAFFANNFLLAGESGYFDAPAATKPLLHLWSLGIEEQFYLLAPALVWLGLRRRGCEAVWLLRLGAASLLWTIWFRHTAGDASFYHPAFRFWELAAGAALAARREHASGAACAWVRRERHAVCLVAIFLLVLQLGAGEWNGAGYAATGGVLLLAACALLLLTSCIPFAPVGRAAAAPVGLLLLCGSVVAMPSFQWPGPQTAMPVIGTLLLLASPESRALSLLKTRLAVQVGRISYPLYLWHWPALVYLRLISPQATPAEVVLTLSAVAILAWVTTVLVEEPIRFGTLGRGKVRRLPAPVLAMLLLFTAALGAVASATQGWPQRFSPPLRDIATWTEDRTYEKWRLGECYYYLNQPKDFAPGCSPPLTAAAPTVLLLGDSHAAHLYIGLAAAARQKNFQLAQWTMGSCLPTLRALGPEPEACAERRARNWELLGTYVPEVVILAGAWSLARQEGHSEASIGQHVAATVQALRRRGVREVLVFGDGPVWSAGFPADLYRHMARHSRSAVPERFGQVTDDLWSLDRTLRFAAEVSGASYFSVLRSLCDERGCRTVGDSAQRRADLLYWDKDHLTASGSRLVIDLARPVLSLTLQRLGRGTQANAGAVARQRPRGRS